MGYGAWTTSSACNYIETKYKVYGASNFADVSKLNVRQVYDSEMLAPELDPKNVIRECRDSEEHPNTLPIILALDVTGSMGEATRNCAAKLNDIMTELYGKAKDIEFLMMGIGDLNYDDAPIQATQFESDVRILDQTTKIYFEAGGGPNQFESYTAAWYFGLHNTDLDCWKRGKKGVIITMGDEPLNPYLPAKQLYEVLGTQGQQVDLRNTIDTEPLYAMAKEKFDIYHIAISDMVSSYKVYQDDIRKTWGELLKQNCIVGKSGDLPAIIGKIVDDHLEEKTETTAAGGIRW